MAALDAQLRRWRPDDADALVRATADADVARQFGGSLDEDAARAWIEARTTGDDEKRASFAIVVDGVAVGDVTVAIEARHRNGWLSYWLEPGSRGRGLASRAAATISEWAFEHRDLFRLELGHRTNNPASGNVAKRAGFMIEGRQRSKLEYDGERFDVASYSRLVTDPAPEIKPLPLLG